MEGSEFQIIERKGGHVLLCNGHQYYKHRKYANESVIWYCCGRKKEKCTGSLTLEGNKIIKSKEHTTPTPGQCKPNEQKNEVALTLDKIKQIGAQKSDPLPTIFNENVRGLYEKGLNFVVPVPSFPNVKHALYNARKKELQITKTVFKSVDEVEVPAKYNKDFLIADYIYEGSRILVFCKSEAKKYFCRVKEYFGDATFRTPYPFSQLFTIHGALGDGSTDTNVVPLVYALMSDKKETTYFALFDILKANFEDFHPQKFHCDFEFAPSNALKAIFPDVTLKKCYYHFTNSIWRKAKSLQIKKNKRYRRIVGLCAALALLPQHLVIQGWTYVQEQANDIQNENMTTFMRYMKRTWLKSDDYVSQWCVYNERHRTNNVAESFHSRLNRLINKNYVTIFKLLHVLYEFSTNPVPKKRRSQEIENDSFIINKQMELIHNDINIGHFLETMR
ncbi:hypothetical protein ABMA28_010136 [Loxostege sticticalis]|uniref:MULE transposase domain-containing protein n=1 Tax=Loxostege sticticalis TaxID=481309 RepID=A0ABD0SDL9_LOXSC